MSSSRAKIVAEVYFGIGLIAATIVTISQIQGQLIDILFVALLIGATILIFLSAFFDLMNLISRLHVVAIFEMTITFGINLGNNFDALKRLLTSGNWSEARSWMLRELKLPLAPWHWMTIEPKYQKLIEKVDQLGALWDVSDKYDYGKVQNKLESLSNNLRDIVVNIAKKNGMATSKKTLLELTTNLYNQKMISESMYELVQILEQVLLLKGRNEILDLVGTKLLNIVPKMTEELEEMSLG